MDLLAEALGQHGYDVTRDAALEGRGGTVYTIPLLAEHDDGAFILDAHLDGVVPLDKLEAMADIRDDVGADGAILCHLEALEPHDTRVATWGRDDLIRILGEAALSSATRYEAPAPEMEAPEIPDGGPVAESLDELLPPAFREAETEEEFTMIDLEALEDLDTPDLADTPDLSLLDQPLDTPDLAPTSEPEPAPTTVPETRYPMLPVRCTAKEAAAAVRERLFQSSQVHMVLHPVYLFDYECDLLAEGSLRYDTINGRIQVHGTHKGVQDVDPEAVDPKGFTRDAGMDLPRDEKALRIDEDRAKQLSREFLVEAHTRLVDVQVDDDEHGFAYTEKRKVAPRPDHIRLAARGVHYRATWRVFGPNGHVDVDALTGTVQQETLQTPDPDVYIMD